MGAVAPEVVVSTFFNFNPELVYSSLPRAWEIASPDALLAARLEAVDAAFRRVLGDAVAIAGNAPRRGPGARHGRDRRDACGGKAALCRPCRPAVARRAASGALARPVHPPGVPGRRPHRAVGHARTVGDRGADHPRRGGRDVRRRPAGDPGLARRAWNAAVARSPGAGLAARGRRSGPDRARERRMRQEIEEQTDVLASAPYAWLGEEDCAELRTLARPWSRLFAEALPL